MPFDEVIERVEKLGAKRPVQTCMKKIRLDMPVLDEDFVGSDKEDMEGDDVVRNMHNDSPQVQCLFLINYLCLNSSVYLYYLFTTQTSAIAIFAI